MSYFGHSGYLEQIFIPKKLASTSKRVAKKLLKLQKTLQFDAIAFRGNSGAGIAYPVSMLTGIPLICVRKGEKSHGQKVEAAQRSIYRYVVLDDFISDGGTLESIIKTIRLVTDNETRCVGVALYDSVRRSSYYISYRGKDTELPVFNV